MSYTINTIKPVPAVEGRTELLVNGKVIVTAVPRKSPDNGYVVTFGGLEITLRETSLPKFLRWAGELADRSNELVSINSKDHLCLAATLTTWSSTSSTGTYRKNDDGSWSWRSGYYTSAYAAWQALPFGPSLAAYPLRLVK